MRRLISFGLLAIACFGCGSTTDHGAGGSPSARQSAVAPTLLVITSLDAASAMSIRLVDRKGRVLATTQFAPPPQPAFSNCADVLQPPVRVARGGVYFADSAGVIHRLALDGTVSQVTTFALTSRQQALSFAVSPDGSQFVAIVLSTPPLHNPPAQTLGDPVFGPGSWSLDFETAAAGSPATVALHKDLGAAFPSPTVITGWDAFGPTATLNSQICVQNVLPSWTYTGTLVHIGLDGTHLEQIGGSGCQAWDELVDSTVLCGATDWQSFSVRRRSGEIVWSRGGSLVTDARMSPDGNGVASADGTIYLRETGHPASFARTAAPGARILGWADPRDVVTLGTDGRLGLAAATDPLTISDLGLTFGGPCLMCVPYGVRLIGTVGA